METIEISYNVDHRGQLGQRPRKVGPGTKIRFICKDPGTFRVEFPGESPFENGATQVKEGEVVVTANRPGKHPFVCILTHDGREVRIGTPGTSEEKEGGDLEIGTGG